MYAERINSWMSQHFLKLNQNKTAVTLFGKNKERLRTATHIDTKGLKAKDSVKIMVSVHLSFDNHVIAITYAKTKAF